MVLEHTFRKGRSEIERGLSGVTNVSAVAGWSGCIKLLCLLVSVGLLSACQSSAPVTSVPVEERGGVVQPPGGNYPESTTPDASGQYPGGNPAPYDRPLPEPSRPEEPPSMDAAIDAIEADAQGFMAQREWKKSIETAEHGLRLDRRNARFYQILGESYRQLGDIPQAQRFARQAQRYCRSDCGSTERLVESLNMD